MTESTGSGMDMDMDMDMATDEPFCEGDGRVMLNGFQVSATAVRFLHRLVCQACVSRWVEAASVGPRLCTSHPLCRLWLRGLEARPRRSHFVRPFDISEP